MASSPHKIIHRKIITPREKKTTSQQNTAPRHLPSSPRHRIQLNLTNRWTPHTSQRGSPQCATPPRESASPDPSHAKEVAEAHTATNWISFVGASPSLPPGAKIGILEENEKDKTALPSPISKLPATRPALSKPPSWVLLRKLSQKRKPHYPRYHLSSTSSCREMEKLSQPRSFVSSPSLPPP